MARKEARLTDERLKELKKEQTQLGNAIKDYEQRLNLQKRNDRTKRLIEHGAIVEMLIEDADKMSTDELMEFLKKHLVLPPATAKDTTTVTSDTVKPESVSSENVAMTPEPNAPSVEITVPELNAPSAKTITRETNSPSAEIMTSEPNAPSTEIITPEAESSATELPITDLSENEQSVIVYTGWQINGGRVEANQQDNMLHVFFDTMPSDDIRGELKNNGFRYAKPLKAWERDLNDSTIKTADRIKCLQPTTGEAPSELQKSLNAPV